MKSQGSLEYLLILAAILAIAVVVVVIANSMLNPAESASSISGDKYRAGLAGYELVDYERPIDYSSQATARETNPPKIKKGDVTFYSNADGNWGIPSWCTTSTDSLYTSRETYAQFFQERGDTLQFTYSNGIDVWYSTDIGNVIPNGVAQRLQAVRYGSPATHCEYYALKCNDGRSFPGFEPQDRCAT